MNRNPAMLGFPSEAKVKKEHFIPAGLKCKWLDLTYALKVYDTGFDNCRIYYLP